MEWWLWLLVAVALAICTAVALIALWLRREWLAIPPDERRSWQELKAELPAALAEFRAGLREDGRAFHRELAEQRRVRKRMAERAQQTRADVYREQYARVQEEIRQESEGR